MSILVFVGNLNALALDNTPAPAITTRPANQSVSGALAWAVCKLPGIAPEATKFLAAHNLRTIHGLVLVDRAPFQRLHGYNRRIGNNIERGLAALGLRLGMYASELSLFVSQPVPQPTAKTLDRRVDGGYLELSPKTADQLKAAQIETIRQLVAKTERQLRRKGLTERSIVEIKNLLSELGLWLEMKPEEIAALPSATTPTTTPAE
ncbi:MAG: DNA-directed RNA polymerase subunit alpha C-terminal domain-containing protein [Candidatus Uhrbacteria bacterium]